jgi:hypothetical protein
MLRTAFEMRGQLVVPMTTINGAGVPWSNRMRTHAAERLSGMFQHLSGLLDRHTRKPFHKFGELRAIFQIFKQGRYRNARTAKYPSAAYALGITFHSRAGRPINHRISVARAHGTFKLMANAKFSGAPWRVRWNVLLAASSALSGSKAPTKLD